MGAHPEKPVIIFDGYCNLCQFWVRFILRHDRKRKFLLAHLHGEFAKNIQAEVRGGLQLPDSMVLLDRDELFFRSAAVLRIMKTLGGIWSLTKVCMILPRGFRDYLYDAVARYRYRIFGSRKNCPVPPPEVADRFLP